MYNDGKVELRFKLPVNKEQVAEKIVILSNGVYSGNMTNECFYFTDPTIDINILLLHNNLEEKRYGKNKAQTSRRP